MSALGRFVIGPVAACILCVSASFTPALAGPSDVPNPNVNSTLPVLPKADIPANSAPGVGGYHLVMSLTVPVELRNVPIDSIDLGCYLTDDVRDAISPIDGSNRFRPSRYSGEGHWSDRFKYGNFRGTFNVRLYQPNFTISPTYVWCTINVGTQSGPHAHTAFWDRFNDSTLSTTGSRYRGITGVMIEPQVGATNCVRVGGPISAAGGSFSLTHGLRCLNNISLTDLTGTPLGYAPRPKSLTDYHSGGEITFTGTGAFVTVSP